jgi:hypothetical protein
VTKRRNGGAPAASPFAPSRFEGLIGAYHQSLATGARLMRSVRLCNRGRCADVIQEDDSTGRPCVARSRMVCS